MLTMLSLFRNNIKKRVNFAPMDKALVFISQKYEFWTPPDEELPSPNGATVSHQYFFYMLVMTISIAEFSRNYFPYVNMSSRKPS